MLCDTGPLVALIDTRQPDHARCRPVFQTHSAAGFLSTWAVWAEAMHLVGKLGGLGYQQQLWDLYFNEVVALRQHSAVETARMAELMTRYGSVPMDLADASLMATAEAISDREIFTLDSDFRIYRFDDGNAFDVFPG